MLARVGDLPTIPLVAHRMGELVNDPRADINKISQVLRADQSLTAKVLRLANSPYYAIPGGVQDVARAVMFLGFNTLYQLVLTASVFEVLKSTDQRGFDPRELWKHSLGCAVLSELVAQHIGFNDPSGCFTGGLLHDIGKVALFHVARPEFIEAIQYARDKQTDFSCAATHLGLPRHDDIGLRLAERWRFPTPIRIAISHHRYENDASRAALPGNLSTYADIARLANNLARRFHIGDPGDTYVPEIDTTLLSRLNLTANDNEKLRTALLRAIDRSQTLLDLLQ